MASAKKWITAAWRKAKALKNQALRRGQNPGPELEPDIYDLSSGSLLVSGRY